jgi:hypothetical protein
MLVQLKMIEYALSQASRSPIAEFANSTVQINFMSAQKFYATLFALGFDISISNIGRGQIFK